MPWMTFAEVRKGHSCQRVRDRLDESFPNVDDSKAFMNFDPLMHLVAEGVLSLSCLKSVLMMKLERQRGAGMFLKTCFRHLLILCVLLKAQVCPAAHLEDPHSSPVIHWQNGDFLHGQLVSADAEQIRWNSPLFETPIALHPLSLKEVRFPRQHPRPMGDFRIRTIFGDILHGPIHASDRDGLVIKHGRLGEVFVAYPHLYSVARTTFPMELADGGRFEDWLVALGGPVQNMSYRIYQTGALAAAFHPENLKASSLMHSGQFASSYFDLGLFQSEGGDVVVFEGDLDIQEAGIQTFQARCDGVGILFVDGKSCLEGFGDTVAGADLELSAGPHRLKLIYAHGGQRPDLRVWWSGVGFRNRSLVGTNRASGWHQDMLGHAHTYNNRSALFRPVDLPSKYEMEIELAGFSRPHFVLALTRNETVAEKASSFRLETLGQELMLHYSGRQESVMMLHENTSELCLRMTFDRDEGSLRFFHGNGKRIKEFEGLPLPDGPLGIYVRNAGESLTVRRCKVRSLLKSEAQTQSKASPVITFAESSSTMQQSEISPQAKFRGGGPDASVDVMADDLLRLDFPNHSLQVPDSEAWWCFGDGEQFYGDLVSMSDDHALLDVGFSDQASKLRTEGLTQLSFLHSPNLYVARQEARDKLDHPLARMRGRLVSGQTGAHPGWQPVGASKASGLRLNQATHIKVHRDHVAPSPSWDPKDFPSKIFTQKGDCFAARIDGLRDAQLIFESPFLTQQGIHIEQVQAIELHHVVPALNSETVSKAPAFMIQAIIDRQNGDSRTVEEMIQPLLDQSAYENPRDWTHLLIARNGDVLKGRWVEMNATHLIFATRVREQRFDRANIAGCIQVQSSKKEKPPEATQAMGLLLADGTQFFWEPQRTSVTDWYGDSPIYGQARVPFQRVMEITAGKRRLEHGLADYRSWIRSGFQSPDD